MSKNKIEIPFKDMIIEINGPPFLLLNRAINWDLPLDELAVLAYLIGEHTRTRLTVHDVMCRFQEEKRIDAAFRRLREMGYVKLKTPREELREMQLNMVGL